jgi:HK97 family phage prohead protease
MKYTFIITDESINSYGFRVLTDGIDFSDFQKNPVALFMHDRADWTLPIGRWDNLRKEGDKLLADLTFDTKDEFALKIQSKVDQKILSACSMGIEAIETSEENVIAGQKRATVTKCLLKEISVVDIPSNKSALRVYLSNDNKSYDSIPTINSSKNKDMKKIALKFGLPEDATEDQIVAKVDALLSENESIKTEKLNAEKESLITLHASKVTEAQKPFLLKMEVLDLKSFLENAPVASTKNTTITEQLGDGVDTNNPRKNWTFSDYTKKDPEALLKLKKENNAEYQRLFKAEYEK